ncbi:hypothetical protein TorRG33x02_325220 [Trema orientale]|uniref:Uncharacterized protein n=1 Tax=Trema orientale TaxID=63057 RepID=A0A2P5BDA1_TREOI|nr:hypothetical protein TorRG33x02_325220 [Trema orientale]
MSRLGATHRRHHRFVEESACKRVLSPRKLSPCALCLSRHKGRDLGVCLQNVYVTVSKNHLRRATGTSQR